MSKLILSFRGKDSVDYKNTVEIPEEIAQAILDLQKDKSPNDKMFSVGGREVTDFLRESGLEDLTPKQFRTAIASKLMVEELIAQNVQRSWPEWKKVAAFNNANLSVAKKLNHQKNVGKNHDDQQTKMSEQIKNSVDKLAERKSKAKEKTLTLKEKLKKTTDKEKRAKIKEQIKKLEEGIVKAEERLAKMKNNKNFKESTKNFALGTSKSAYATPKVVFSFCKDVGLDPGKIYSKSLLTKYDWAKNTPASYWKNYVKEI